jgi:hypothetical protein
MPISISIAVFADTKGLGGQILILVDSVYYTSASNGLQNQVPCGRYYKSQMGVRVSQKRRVWDVSVLPRLYSGLFRFSHSLVSRRSFTNRFRKV